MLKPGERLHTALFNDQTPEKTAYIYGCPYCYSKKTNKTPHPHLFKKKRICPVCDYKLGNHDYLIGRLSQGEAKIGLRILGCSHCHKRLKA